MVDYDKQWEKAERSYDKRIEKHQLAIQKLQREKWDKRDKLHHKAVVAMVKTVDKARKDIARKRKRQG